MSNIPRGWARGSHGLYISRGDYDEGPNGDNWSYIVFGNKDYNIVDFRPKDDDIGMNKTGKKIAGPFPTLEAAKAAFVLIYGGPTHG